MQISATLTNEGQTNHIVVSTNKKEKEICIPAKAEGLGSSVNGGELLMLAIATCFCNDIYREAGRRNMQIGGIEITVRGDFANEAQPGTNLSYTAKVNCPSHSDEEVKDLIHYVDQIAEIHNTVRRGTAIRLEPIAS
jgi:organic hydroperoxide reductase OsmC/OhrA